MTSPMQESAESDKLSLFRSVALTVSRLQDDYLSTNNYSAQASARGALANLRKTGSTKLDNNPMALASVLSVLYSPLSEEEIGKNDWLTPSEKAVYYCLVAFAQHMQGATTKAHEQGVGFARACGRLYATSASNSIKPRFDAMLLSRDENSMAVHLRSLISLLRNTGLPFDYARFAQDLRVLVRSTKNTEDERARDRVQLRWSRDFAAGAYYDRAAETAE